MLNRSFVFLTMLALALLCPFVSVQSAGPGCMDKLCGIAGACATAGCANAGGSVSCGPAPSFTYASINTTDVEINYDCGGFAAGVDCGEYNDGNCYTRAYYAAMNCNTALPCPTQRFGSQKMCRNTPC